MSALLLILSTLIVGLGQPAWMAWLSPVAATCGYALFWHVSCKIPPAKKGAKKRFLFSTAWFALIQLIQLSWMTSIEFQGFYILIVYALLAIGLGLQFGVLTHFIDRIPFVASASLWALMEWSRLYFLCGFTFNPIGLSLTATPFSLQAVTFLGIFGLSFWVILTNLAVWKKRWTAAAVLTISPYVLGGVIWAIHHARVQESPVMNVALVQTALLPSQKLYFPERAADFIPPHQQWNRITALLAQVKKPVDLVVLPESAVSYSDQYPLYSHEVVTKILQESFNKQFSDTKNTATNQTWTHAISEILDADVIIGLDGEEKGHHYSSAFFSSKETIKRYDKQILLPLAEYLPFTSLIALTKSYGISQFFTHGTESKLFHSKVPLSTSICYEETFGHILREGRKNGAALFVNVTNDNWYPNSKLPKQHFDLAKAQAVANGTPLVRACNAGVTCAVDCLGGVVAQLDDWGSPAVLVAQVPLYQVKTLYTLVGDMGIVLISIVLLIFAVVINRAVLGLNVKQN